MIGVCVRTPSHSHDWAAADGMLNRTACVDFASWHDGVIDIRDVEACSDACPRRSTELLLADPICVYGVSV